MVSTRANEYTFDGTYADAVTAAVGNYMIKAWPPVAALASAFKSDIPLVSSGAVYYSLDDSDPSSWTKKYVRCPEGTDCVDDLYTAKLLYFMFRATPDIFTAMYAGFENGKFIAYGRWGPHPKAFEPSLSYMKDENSTCNYKPYNISSKCRFTYINSTDHTTGTINGKPSSASVYDPRVRSWYKGAKADTAGTGTYWTGIYNFASGGIGITASQQLVSSSGSFLGAVGLDIMLEELEGILDLSDYEDDDGEATFTSFIVDANHNLVATSVSGYAFRNGSQVPAINCSYKTVSSYKTE